MKTRLIFSFILLLCMSAAQMQAANDWENPKMIGLNKLPGHATFIPHSDLKSALTFDKTKSDQILSLNGEWKFKYVPKISDVPEGFYKTDYKDKKWDTLPVPSCWQTKGYGRPIYNPGRFIIT